MGQDVEDLKAKGNQSFKEGAYQQAVELYTQALDAAAENAVLYSNRCAALLKLGRVGEARADAEKCINLRREWEKAHFRLGSVCVEEGNWEEVSG
jgi:tetratricopeptide (TPR) repeat protein